MPATSHKLGPGLLTFGEAGDAAEFGVNVTNVTLEPETDQEDDIVTLSWDTVAGDTTDSATIKGEMLQSFDKDSLLLWAHNHHLEVLPFVFKPVQTQALKATGNVQITRVGFGGDVKKRNTSDFEFKIIGDYDLTAEPAAG